MNTTGQTVLITGGSRGIGLALAKRFCDAGNRVIITGRNLQTLSQAKEAMPQIETFVADMANEADLKRLCETYPDVSVLINNAGVQYNYDFTQSYDFSAIQSEIQINITGLIQLVGLYLPKLLQSENAAIVNVTSALGYVPKQSAPVYCATKAAVHSFTQSLRWQLENTSVVVYELIPSLVETEMTAGRGSGKITPEQLVDEFWGAFKQDRFVIPIGQAKTLLLLNRWLPGVAQRILRHS